MTLSDKSSGDFACDGTPGMVRMASATGITSVDVVPSHGSTIWSVSVARPSN